MPVIAKRPDYVAPAPNGIPFPDDYQNWRVISVTQRSDNDTIRAVIGNDIAIAAARAGHTNPWPDGSVLGKVVWQSAPNANWPTALTTGDFVQVEFMFKSLKQYAGNDTGWGWARWKGLELFAYGDDETFETECIQCHKPVSGNDWVFTHPALLP